MVPVGRSPTPRRPHRSDLVGAIGHPVTSRDIPCQLFFRPLGRAEKELTPENPDPAPATRSRCFPGPATLHRGDLRPVALRARHRLPPAAQPAAESGGGHLAAGTAS